MLSIQRYQSGIAGNNTGCAEGPAAIFKAMQSTALPIQWSTALNPQETVRKLQALPEVRRLCQALADQTIQAITQNQAFLTLGGDHTCAIGTWSGAAKALAAKGDLGLIWFDAHFDSHTPDSSFTKNIHGMPLATLLGHGESTLTQLCGLSPKLKPENLVIIGARSYEEAEQNLLKSLGVRVYYMPEILEKGMETVMQLAIAQVSQHTAGFGLSLDLDGIDPQDAPGVGVPEENGVRASDLLHSLKQLHHPKFIGAEIAELNPSLDVNAQTTLLACQIIEAVFQ